MSFSSVDDWLESRFLRSQYSEVMAGYSLDTLTNMSDEDLRTVLQLFNKRPGDALKGRLLLETLVKHNFLQVKQEEKTEEVVEPAAAMAAPAVVIEDSASDSDDSEPSSEPEPPDAVEMVDGKRADGAVEMSETPDEDGDNEDDSSSDSAPPAPRHNIAPSIPDSESEEEAPSAPSQELKTPELEEEVVDSIEPDVPPPVPAGLSSDDESSEPPDVGVAPLSVADQALLIKGSVLTKYKRGKGQQRLVWFAKDFQRLIWGDPVAKKVTGYRQMSDLVNVSLGCKGATHIKHALTLTFSNGTPLYLEAQDSESAEKWIRGITWVMESRKEQQ